MWYYRRKGPLRRERVFRDRRNPMDFFDDEELYTGTFCEVIVYLRNVFRNVAMNTHHARLLTPDGRSQATAMCSSER